MVVDFQVAFAAFAAFLVVAVAVAAAAVVVGVGVERNLEAYIASSCQV